MKGTSRPHPHPPVRPAPYRKRKSSGAVSPTRGTRRVHDASQPQGQTREISPRPLDRAHGSRQDNGHSISFADDEHRPLAKTGGKRAVPHTRRNTTTGGSAHERPSNTSALSTHVDMSDSSLRFPPAFAPPTTTVFNGQKRVDSPMPGSVTTFLRSIELPDKPSTAPPVQSSFSLGPPSLHPPSISTDNANKAACTNGNGYQINLVYKGYPFTYDLSALPEDPKGTIALLSITKSDPGAYILVGAHYRRTGRSRAACAVIRSLLDNLDTSSDVEKGKGDGTLYAHPRIMWFENAFTAAPVPPSAASTVTLVSPDSPCPGSRIQTGPVHRSAAVRPAMLLLAACELDISRERPGDPESSRHASAAHELFRAVYGTVNNGIIAGAVRPQPKNALGLEFPSSGNGPSPPGANGHSPNNGMPSGTEPLARVNDVEKELSIARAAQKRLQERLTVSNERLTRTERKVHALESHSREMLGRLDVWRDENWELRQRLTESERRAREMVQCPPSAENRVWGRLKDLLFDNLGSVRGE